MPKRSTHHDFRTRAVENQDILERHAAGLQLSAPEKNRLPVLLAQVRRKELKHMGLAPVTRKDRSRANEAYGPHHRRLWPLSTSVLVLIAELRFETTAREVILTMSPTSEKHVRLSLRELIELDYLTVGDGDLDWSDQAIVSCTTKAWSLLSVIAAGTLGQMSKKIVTASLRRNNEEEAMLARIRRVISTGAKSKRARRRYEAESVEAPDEADEEYEAPSDGASDVEQWGTGELDVRGDRSDGEVADENRFNGSETDSRPRPSCAPSFSAPPRPAWSY